MARSRKHLDKSFEERQRLEYLESFPQYPAIPGAAKFRKIPRDQLTAEQKAAYSAVIVRTVLELQRKALQRELPEIKPSCASGTWHNMADGSVGRAIRKQQHEALLRAPDSIRAKRTDKQLIELYEEAMAAKRAREAAEMKEAA